MTTILVAEDDANIREGLLVLLDGEGYKTVGAKDGLDALRLWRETRPGLVLLDVMMPGKSGYDVCREIRAAGSRVPVIMLTAKGEEIDKVLGLELGADDYVTKPFGVKELLARVAAVLRRAAPAASPTQSAFPFGGSDVDAKRYVIATGETEFPLSDKELKLIETFRAHPGEALSRDRLLTDIWGVSYYGTTRTLDQHIAQLRKKLAVPSSIETVHGIGYRYKA
jgi:DNA-binding response OmpR family regulator